MRLPANKRDTAKHQDADLQRIGNLINQNLASAAASAAHKLETIVSSDSYSMESNSLSFELRHLGDENSPRSALMSAADEWYGQNRDATDENRDAPPPPPPPPTAPPPVQAVQSNYVRLNENDNRSVISATSGLTSGLTVTRTFSQSQKQIASLKQQEESRQERADHKKALLSLLQQLKDSETAHAALQKQYQSEKAELMSYISKQEEHMSEVHKRLEATEGQLAKQKKEPLVKVLSQLSNFAKGCNDYAKTSNSASVKKMSDALRVQVGEWANVHDVELNEEEEQSSMDMIHELQMEVKMLKVENAKLRQQSSASRAARNVASGETSTLSTGSSYSHGSRAIMDDSDEVSQLSGVTSMSSCTKMSAIAAFPTDFDDTGRSGKSKESSSSKMSAPPPPARSSKSSSSRIPPRPAGRKVHIHATPQILSSDEEGNAHEDFSAASSSPRSIMKKSTYRKGGRPKRVQLQTSPVPDEANLITHGFADFDSAFGEFGDGHEVEV